MVVAAAAGIDVPDDEFDVVVEVVRPSVVSAATSSTAVTTGPLAPFNTGGGTRMSLKRPSI